MIAELAHAHACPHCGAPSVCLVMILPRAGLRGVLGVPETGAGGWVNPP
jgi:hypothetical protein